nr:NADH-quinone oxidoreductase subunit NuoH [Anaerolineae bacterium]
MEDLFIIIYNWLVSLLSGWGVGPVLVDIILGVLGSVLIVAYLLTLALFIIWVERKLVARIQDRIGPNRVGPWGLFQNIADVLKLLTKEIIIPDGADLVPFMLAPMIAVASVFMIWAALPFTRNAVGTNVSIGVLYIVAVSSLSIMAVLMAGWSSNNKYALLGAFRGVAMLVSYEVPMILTLLVPVFLTGSMRVNEIVGAQTIWYVIAMPIAAVIFYIANHAEAGRSPFDMLEAESEIVAGFHIEYSGMAFAMFYLAEFLHAFTISALTATLFFGGWRGPFVEQVPTLGIIYFFIKTFAIYLFNVWARGTLVRLRIDQIMSFCWKFLVPIALILLVLSMLVDKIATGIIPNYLDTTLLGMLPRTGILLLVNLVVGALAFGWIARTGRRERERLESRQIAPVERPAAGQQAK